MREASRNKFVEKDGVPDKVESSGEVDSNKYRLRAMLGFIKPIRNGLGKIKNLIKSRLFREETGLAERENKVRL